ncbi:MAG: SNF2-related protein [Chitinophagales bacterium]
MSATSIIIQRYIGNNSTTKSRSKGQSIFKRNAYELERLDIDREIAIYRVSSEYSFEKYKVLITDFKTGGTIEAECSCPYDWGGICKHRVAALLALEKKMRDKGKIEKVESYNQAHTVLYMKSIKENIIHHNMAHENWTRARQLAKTGRAVIRHSGDRMVNATVKFKGANHGVEIKKIGEDKIITSCTCNESQYKICLHKAVVFLQLKSERGDQAFESIRDWTSRKNQLLADYGFSLADDLNNKFEFAMEKGKPELKVLDGSLVKINDLEKWGKKFKTIELKDKALPIPIQEGKVLLPEKEILTTAFIFNFDDNTYLPGFSIQAVCGKLNAQGDKISAKLKMLTDDSGNVSSRFLSILDDKDRMILQLTHELSREEVAQYAFSHSMCKLTTVAKYSGGVASLLEQKNLKGAASQVTQTYISQRLQNLFDLLQDKITYINILPARTLPNLKDLEIVDIAPALAKIHFSLHNQGDLIQLSSFIQYKDQIAPIDKVQLVSQQILYQNNQLYLIENMEELESLQLFLEHPTISVRKERLPALIKNVVIPLQSKHPVDIQLDLKINTETESEAKAQLFLKETEDFLLFQPVVNYNGQQLELDSTSEWVIEKEGEVTRMARNVEFDQSFNTLMQTLHPDFTQQATEITNGLYYFLNYEEVMENEWFLDAFEKLEKSKVEIFGFKSLSRFHYDLHRPTMDFDVTSGIDWFDIRADVSFGDELVSLKEVQRALLRNENFVRLNNGKLGVLPEKWLAKYADLFKLSSIKGKDLRISKVHFSLVDELYEMIDDEEVQKELFLKKQKLKNFKNVAQVQMPINIKAELRDYQKEGYNWMNFLDEFQWGGCLADDMGLGKTLQVLTLLQHKKEENPENTNLVVAPTTLLFNWEKEVEKFCPEISIFRHHGPFREKSTSKHFEDYDIIITSYGTLTSDIDLFSKYEFNYIVLDESQAIKNPSTKRYKASRLLKAKNRIALTGTPIENNTFDLYAQMNFLNPGMLGSMEFFKKEFANPIDKHSDAMKAKALRKIVYPFILRRTKELVAKELPEKTETVLYCEMQTPQRKVYEAFRDNYRLKILEKIDEDGMSKAGMYILEGLMKLRQICNSPALLNDTEDYGKDSIKLKELMAHVNDISGNHKILVFSQFLGMLSMIKEQLEKQGIEYEYLDGSLTPKARKNAVDHFQSDDKCRIFLISLKAGSLGLTLTEADYVYLVDPWWNPAVEQQAIDRTHRIGQTKNVFAYRMICRDTIEEKIMSLQDKKRALAADLISTEKSFMKKLDRGDVAFLFS